MSGADFATRFPVYQIDFQAVAAGKTIASTKRKIRWRFGFPNKQALAAGRTGIDCRGEEHDVVVIWSITSGKRQVYMDGTEIHFSTSRAGTFQYSWSAKGNHVIKILAHASAPLNGISATPGFRQYDMHIDGQSFFIMPKAYEIGISGGRSQQQQNSNGGYHSSPSRSSAMGSPRNRDEEDTDLQRAINASLQESRQFLSTKGQPESRGVPAPVSQQAPPVADFDLMGLEGPPPSCPPQSVSVPPSYASPPPAQYVAPPPAQYGAPPPTQYGAQPPAQYAAPPPQNGYQQSPGYASQGPPPQQQSYQSPQPGAPGALVVSHVPSQPYAVVPPATPTYQAPLPAYASPPPQSVAPSYGSPQPAYGAPTPPDYGAPPPQGGVPTGNFFAPAPVDPFAPRASAASDPYGLASPVLDDPFAPRAPPPPTRQDVTNSILNAYGGPPPQQQQGHHGQQQSQPGQPMPQANSQPQANGPALTMSGYALTANAQEKPLSEMEKAMKKLVNVERIDEPAEQEYKLTMMKKEEDLMKRKNGKSHGLPPVATGVVGSNATLSDINRVKDHTPKTGQGVMKAPPQLFHPDAVHAGALVIHGQAPPLQQGFGVGYGTPPPNYNQQRW